MIEWRYDKQLIPYPEAMRFMETRCVEIKDHKAPDLIWGLQHPPTYTQGIRGKASDVLDANKIPIYSTSRGGQTTYHGPGQLIIYIMRRLEGEEKDVRRFVATLESWGIACLKSFGIHGYVIPGKTGVWINDGNGEAKIMSLGIRISRWVTSHGLALNVSSDITPFSRIVPCGLPGAKAACIDPQGILSCSAVWERFKEFSPYAH